VDFIDKVKENEKDEEKRNRKAEQAIEIYECFKQEFEEKAKKLENTKLQEF